MRNEFEKKLARQIKRAKLKVLYETAKIPYTLAGYYIPDFVLDTPTGQIFIEAKGYFRPEAKRKLRAVKNIHPELDFRIIFYPFPDTKSGNKRKEAYTRWADAHGFKYAIGKIPSKWLKGL